jgi:hypothetical protein
LGLDARDLIERGCRTEMVCADESDEFVAEGGGETSEFGGGVHTAVEILRASKSAALRMTRYMQWETDYKHNMRRRKTAT